MPRWLSSSLRRADTPLHGATRLEHHGIATGTCAPSSSKVAGEELLVGGTACTNTGASGRSRQRTSGGRRRGEMGHIAASNVGADFRKRDSIFFSRGRRKKRFFRLARGDLPDFLAVT